MATTKKTKPVTKAAKTAAKSTAKPVTKVKAKATDKVTPKKVSSAKTNTKTGAKTSVKVAPAKTPVKTASKVSAPKKREASAPRLAIKTAPVKTPSKPITKKTTQATVKSNSLKTVSPAFLPYVPKKGEDYMNKEQLAHFADILSSLKVKLLADVERTVHTMQDEQTVFADPNDRASQETDIALELRNRDRERKLIKKIEETLGRIRNDDYGFCDKCGVEIGIQRLEARPTATLCIDCKTLEELREKQVAK